MKDRSRKGGKKDVSSPCSHLVFFSNPHIHVLRRPACSWNIKGASFELSECIVFLQALILSSPQLLLPCSAVNCAAKVVAIIPWASRRRPDRRRAAPTKEGHSTLPLTAAFYLQHQPPWTVRPSQTKTRTFSLLPLESDCVLGKAGHRLEPGTNIPILLEWFKNCV